MTPSPRILILGAGYAGVLAALRLAGKAPQAQIMLVNPSPYFVERIRLHQFLAHQPLAKHPLDTLLRGTGIRRVEGFASHIDTDRRQVAVSTNGVVEHLPYDYLVYTLGSRSHTGGVSGAAEHAYSLNMTGHHSLTALRDQLPHIRRLTVVGAGLTGIEAVTELAESFPKLHLTLVDSGTIGADLSGKGQAYLRRTLTEMGIALHEGVRVQQVDAAGLTFADGSTLAQDACLWAAGFSLPELARTSGLSVNAVGQVRVDRQLRSLSHPEVYAAGDSAFIESAPLRMGCVTAMPLGAHVADNLAAHLSDQPERPFGFGFVVRCISLGRRRGLVQWVRADDQPQERIINGRCGAVIKEMICLYTRYSLLLERRWPGLYRWAGQHKPQSAAATEEAYGVI